MSGFLYRGRHCTGNGEEIHMPRRKTQTNELSSNESEKGAPLQSHSLRGLEKHLNDLKKENFSLKLRIYFLEEKIQGRCEDGSSEDVHKKNIELKVQVESLKQELLERQQPLEKAVITPTDQHTAEVQHRCEKGQQEIPQSQDVLQNKIQLLQKEADLSRSEAVRMSQRCVDLEIRMMEMDNKDSQEEMPAEKERLIRTLTETLRKKEEEVSSLQEERESLNHRVTQLEEELQVLSKSLRQKEEDGKILKEEVDLEKNLKQQLKMEKLIGEQQVQLVQYENAAGQCVSELQKARLQVQSLQTEIRQSEAINKELQERLGVTEAELLSLRETAQGQERTIQTLSDSLSTKDTEVADLLQLTEEQKQLLISLTRQNQKHQLQNLQTSTTAPTPELLEVQVSLFSTQLELRSEQRAQRQAQRREDELTLTNQRLLAHLQEEQYHRQEAEKHNQELLATLQRVRLDLKQMDEKRNEGLRDKEREIEERERSIRELKTRLQRKEHLLHDYTELLDGQNEAGGNRDVLIHKLKLRIQDRDRALERALDERFVCVEQKEAEVCKLQLFLREKERDLQSLRGVLANNQETITSLEMLLRGKSVELEQVSEAWRGCQRVQREFEDRHKCSLRQRDTLISQLQTTLHTRTKEAEEFIAALFSKMPLSSGELVEKLKAQLKVQERFFQELLSQHSRQAQEHHIHIQELLNAMGTREKCIKDAAERAGHVMAEQAARLQELRRQVVSAGSRSPSASEPPEDVQRLREELQLALSKHREAQRELYILRSTIATGQHRLQTQTAQLSALSHTSNAEEAVSMETEQTANSQAETGDSTSEVEHEEEESTEEEEQCKVTAQALANAQAYERAQLSQAPAEVEALGLAEVKLLVEQKQAVERELWELKAQLEKAGFNSLSQMRKALLGLHLENDELRNTRRTNETEEEEETHRPSDEQRGRGVQWQCQPCESKKRSGKGICLEPGAQHSYATQAVQQKLQESPMVCKSPTQTQAERLRDYMETPVKQDSKQVQVDLQDLGYETCGRSENEAERDDTSSPEFDDLELCTTLSCRDGAPQWWSGLDAVDQAGGDVASLQQQVENLQVQLSRSQALVLSLQTRLQDDTTNLSGRKSNWDDRELRELVTRVTSLEEHIRKGRSQAGGEVEEARSSGRAGKFDTLIQAQARELSHLRQQMREGRSVCHILTQHLGDTTKSFEELLRANDIDYYMSQSFREQLAHSSALALRVRAKISSRDYSEVADDRTDHELLTIQLSKELQQKDKLIESLRSKLRQQPAAALATSSPTLGGEADQLKQAFFPTDDQGFTNEDLDLCSELDNVSEFGQEDVADDSLRPAPSHPYSSNLPSFASSHGHQSFSSCPSVRCSPRRLIDGLTELTSAPLPPNPGCLSAQMAFQPFNSHTQHPRLRSSTTGGFTLAEVHQELQRLQRQLAHSFSGAQDKPLPAVFQPPDHADFHLPSQHAFQHSPFANLDMVYGHQQKRGSVYNDASSNSSGYQSGTRHTETHLTEEHLREIRCLHRHLEESIQTNERLRQQLAERFGSKIHKGGAPTNIYVQGLDSVSQLSNEVRVLREGNRALQSQLQQASREAEQLRDAVLLEHTRLKQSELEVEKWAGQFEQLQAQLREQTQAVLQLKQDKQMSQENANRLQNQVHVLQQQLSESRQLVQALQSELQIYQRLCGATHNDIEDLPLSPPVRDAGLLNPALSVSAQRPSCLPVKPRTGCHEAEVPDDSFVCRGGSHVMVRWDDFSVLQQQLLESKMLSCKMEAALQNGVEINLHEGRVSNMLTSTKTLKQILEEMCSVLKMFWRAPLPSAEITTAQHHKEQTLTEEVVCLRHKLGEQEKTLRDTLETLRDSNRTKDSMEHFIFSQLSRTRDILKKARTNLEVKSQTLGAAPLPDRGS